MDKIKQKYNEIKKYPIIILFFSMIFIITILDVVTPQEDFSSLENKYLQKIPEFTVGDFISNKYVNKYEKYINDQFVFRNRWISLKSKVEHYLGKLENNNIIYGKDNYLFDKVQVINNKYLNKNIKYIDKFYEKYPDLNITFGLIPNSFQIYSDRLPFGLKLYNQENMIKDVYGHLSKYNNNYSLNFMDIMKKHKNEYIYYKTDHHWTTLGAYYAYAECMKNKNNNIIDISNINVNKVKYFLGTYFSKAKNFNAEYDTISYYDIDVEGLYVGDEKYDSIYDLDKFNKRDKYSAFIRGNNDVTVIRRVGCNKIKEENRTKVLLIKDSFGNSMAPFMVYNYDEIYIVDLRMSTTKVSELLKNCKFKDIFVIYSVNNFINDVNLVKLLY